jgi:rare lipoprotein A (peptidoglycan hydrolase)
VSQPAQFPARFSINTVGGSGIVGLFSTSFFTWFVVRTIPEVSSMKIVIATGIVLLSLCSIAEAHRLSGTATYYGGSDRLCGRRTASGVALNCSAMTAAHRTLPFGTVLSVQSGGRSIQVMVNDRGPFTGAFLDLSPAAASALGCRCTHRNVTATVVQMGAAGNAVASRGRQRSLAAAAMPQFSPTEDVMRPLAMFGSSMAMAPAPRHRDRDRGRH